MLGSIMNISPIHCCVPTIMPFWDQPCPFCGLCFIRLGSHLPCCKERNGGDSSAFLARSVVLQSAHGTCSSCGCLFNHLDTHLRVSASCRRVATNNPLPTDALVTPQSVSSTVNPFTRPQLPKFTRPQHPHLYSPASSCL